MEFYIINMWLGILFVGIYLGEVKFDMYLIFFYKGWYCIVMI